LSNECIKTPLRFAVATDDPQSLHTHIERVHTFDLNRSNPHYLQIASQNRLHGL